LNERLPSGLEVAALCRQAEASGGFAAVLRRGDPDRGDLVVQIIESGRDAARLERRLSQDFTYRWSRMPDEPFSPVDRARIDPDFWLIELDVADAERFIAEMIASG
jgi:hypothetical protein